MTSYKATFFFSLFLFVKSIRTRPSCLPSPLPSLGAGQVQSSEQVEQQLIANLSLEHVQASRLERETTDRRRPPHRNQPKSLMGDSLTPALPCPTRPPIHPKALIARSSRGSCRFHPVLTFDPDSIQIHTHTHPRGRARR